VNVVKSTTTRTLASTYVQDQMRSNHNHNNRHLSTNHLVSLFMSSYDDDEDEDDEVSEEMSEEERERIRKFREQMLSGESSMGFSNLFSGDDDDDEDEEEEEDDETEEDDEIEIEVKMSTNKVQDEGGIDELIRLASSKGEAEAKENEWAIPLEAPSGNEGSILDGGVVLVANPAVFCTDFVDSKNKQVSPSLLAKFGLTIPPPAELGADRRADLLPVIILIDANKLMGSVGVLMNRRTGYLIGDLEQQRPPMPGPDADDSVIASQSAGTDDYLPKLGAFMIQPLWFGGTSSSSNQDRNNASGGIDMLHMCDMVKGSRQLTEDGLFWGGEPAQAQDVMSDAKKTGFDFKFFVQSTRWLPTQLEKEVRDRTWFVASVSKEVLFKSRDRLGTRRGKPLWTEIMELMGGEYRDVRDQLYEGED